MSPSSPARWRRLLGVVAACIVAACGGSGSVGSGGTGSVAVGTVTGFGSLVVDGVAFDDSRTVARVENEPGAETPAEVRLGHRVEVEFDEANVALAIRVEAGVRGPVANRTADGLVVLGQRIVVNTDATVGPLTQFGGGYAGLGDVSPADLVEVHGVLLPLAAGGPVIQATRIDRQESLSAWRVTGVVSERSDTGFRLGTQAVSTAGAQVVPAAARLADGQVVRVLAAPGDGAAPLQARQVRLRTVPERSRAQVSGAVAAHDPLARTFLAGPQKVSYSALTVTLAEGAYVRARGVTSSDGTLAADEIVVRTRTPGGPAESLLRGTVSALDETARTFSVRGVTVRYAPVQTLFLGCLPTPLADGGFVEVEGNLGTTAVLATRIACGAEPAGAVIERTGTVAEVDPSARTFVLGTAAGPLTVTWSPDATVLLAFGIGGQPALGMQLAVEGVLENGTLVARKIRLRRAP